MKRSFGGRKYDYQIMLDDDARLCGFSILAICKQTGRCSSINNLNQMLSELDVNPDNPKYEDSAWVLPAKEAKRLYRKVVSIFSIPSFPEFLERFLDDDRSCGEWENVYNPMTNI